MDDYLEFIQNYEVGKPDECWIWKGSRSAGRGVFGKFGYAHRVMFFLRNGFLPENVHHECRNYLCVNPDDLKGMTHAAHLSLHHKGKTFAARGERHGSRTHPERVARGERSGAYTHPEKILRGEQIGNAVLTEEKVRQIFALSNKGLNRNKISKIIGCSWNAVDDVLSRKYWKHVVI
jgi:hypothetical protein